MRKKTALVPPKWDRMREVLNYKNQHDIGKDLFLTFEEAKEAATERMLSKIEELEGELAGWKRDLAMLEKEEPETTTPPVETTEGAR